ncbi:MAG TPA: hypothetical protein VML75_28655 [Kofleriaceae bacterium]|nr:hypothetical protein [Kofleriaceae bacterium]
MGVGIGRGTSALAVSALAVSALVMAVLGSLASAARATPDAIGPFAIGERTRLDGAFGDRDIDKKGEYYHRYVIEAQPVGTRLIVVMTTSVPHPDVRLEQDAGVAPTRQSSRILEVNGCVCGTRVVLDLNSASRHVLWVRSAGKNPYRVTIERVANGDEVAPIARQAPAPVRVVETTARPRKPLWRAQPPAPGALGPLRAGQKVTREGTLGAADWNARQSRYVRRIPLLGSANARYRVRVRAAAMRPVELEVEPRALVRAPVRRSREMGTTGSEDGFASLILADRAYEIEVSFRDPSHRGLKPGAFELVVERLPDPGRTACSKPDATVTGDATVGPIAPGKSIVVGAALGPSDWDGAALSSRRLRLRPGPGGRLRATVIIEEHDEHDRMPNKLLADAHDRLAPTGLRLVDAAGRPVHSTVYRTKNLVPSSGIEVRAPSDGEYALDLVFPGRLAHPRPIRVCVEREPERAP